VDDDTKNHAKFLMLYHMIFVCKYRKNLLTLYGDETKRIFKDIVTHSDFSFETREVDKDHIHCLVKSEPGISPLAIVRRLKQESTIQHRLAHEQELRRHLVMDTFVALLATPARIPSASTLRVKGEDGVSSTKLKTSWFSRRTQIKLNDIRPDTLIILI